MEFKEDEVLKKYLDLYEKHVKGFIPDMDMTDKTLRYVRFNDAWRGLEPFERFLIPRLTNKKNTFPKKPLNKLSKNANPDNYVTLKYDLEGRLIQTFYPDYYNCYVSKNLTVSLRYDKDDKAFEPIEFFWYEYDEDDRIISAEQFFGSGRSGDDFKYWGEFYEYNEDHLETVWRFNEYQRYPMKMTVSMILNIMPDRLCFPDRYKYTFSKDGDGLKYICEHYYRKSQTLTHEDHVSKETLLHLKENGLCLVKDL